MSRRVRDRLTDDVRFVFPSSNPLGIPDLRPDRLIETWPSKIVMPGWSPRSEWEGGTVAWWVDDYRFHGAYSKPSLFQRSLREAGVRDLVAPDYSCYLRQPLASQQYAVYRSAWAARYWQECGWRVVPNLTWTTYESLEWSLGGIPLRAPIVACECRQATLDRDGFSRCLVRALETLRPQRLLIYGVDPCISGIETRIYSAESPRLRMSAT